jgi:cellulose synthase/poly-beta-1,6-N-acetylglucosamine synthase-like glycosyltransferase
MTSWSKSPTVRLSAVALLFALVWCGLEALVALWFPVRPNLALHIALLTIGFEIASGTLALILARGHYKESRLPRLPRVSVLVAAYNEASGIVATVRSIQAQQDVTTEIVIADDGSSDDSLAILTGAFGLSRMAPGSPLTSPDGTLTVLALPHRGKASALNAAATIARHPLLVTVDADTLLAPLALARLASAFEDPQVAAATGSVLVSPSRALLQRFQQIEYVRNTMLRLAWSRLGALEQLPGAFTAMRADWLAAVNGFPEDSPTEDYELIYRFYDRAARERLPMRIAVVPTALATTDAPSTLGPLLRQRVRWFVGFLTTLVRFRHLIGRPRAGLFGMLKLPVKVVDALHPALSLASLGILVTVSITLPSLRLLSVSLFFLRWAWDSYTLGMAVRFARRGGANVQLSDRWLWLYVLADGVSYFWLRQLAVLRAYGRMARAANDWMPTRVPAEARESFSSPAIDPRPI